MRILTCSEACEAANGPEASPQVLMRRAGYAVAQFCASQFKFSSVCVLCGRGKNGGAGLIAAEVLKRVADTVSVIILANGADELNPDVVACLGPDVEPIWIRGETDFASDAAQQALAADLVIDAIVGTGFKPPLHGLIAAAVAAVNDAPGTIVSVDVPTGVDAESRTPLLASGGNMVFPHGVIALIAPKPAHVFGQLTAGPIAVNEIGVQPVYVPSATGVAVITGREVGITFAPLPNENEEGHFGHVLVIAGSVGREGTAVLAGLAALNTGAGRVTVASPKSIRSTIASFSTALATYGLPETDQGSIAATASDKIDALLAGKDVIIIGPGLSHDPSTSAFVRRLVSGCALPVIIDGDGVDAFEGRFHELKRSAATPFLVLMPHSGQAARLADMSIDSIQADTMKAAQQISRATGCCVVLKGRRTVVAGASDETWINLSGNAVLAKAGVDELLSGIVGAALARHFNHRADAADPGQTADRQFQRMLLNDLRVAAAVHLHGLAGDIACDALHANTVGPTDVLEALVEAFRDCELQVEQNLFYLRK